MSSTPLYRSSANIMVLLLLAGLEALGLKGPPTSPVIKTTTQLVQVPVVVTSGSGFPVVGLGRADFQITVDGQDAPIRIFAADNSSSSADSLAPIPRLGRFSNEADRNEELTCNVLLLDQLDTTLADWQRGLPLILRFLGGLKREDHVAIYLLEPTNGLEVLQDCSDDTGQLVSRLKRSIHPSLLALVRPGEPVPTAEPSFSERDEAVERWELLSLGRVQGTVKAMQVIADHFAGASGAKSLIWFAGDFPNVFNVNRDNAFLEAARLRLLRALNNVISANIAIYPVDARGLMVDRSFDADNEYLPIGTDGPYPFPQYRFSPLMEIARQSGGKAFFNTNGLEETFKEIAQRRNGSYILGFYATKKPDGRFHRIKIRTYKDEVHLYYKRGYWALSEADPADPSYQERTEAALESPFVATSIELQVQAVLKSARHIQAIIYINPSNLNLFPTKAVQASTTLDVAFGQKDATGRVFAIPPYRVPVILTYSMSATRVWLRTQATLAVRAQSRLVRIVVRDETTGRVGSVDVPLGNLENL